MISNTKAVEFVRRVRRGEKLSIEEVGILETKLSGVTPPHDLHNIARAFALASPTPSQSEIKLVDRYLSLETDDYDLKGVIYALCDYWRLTAQYLDQLRVIASPNSPLEFGDASVASISALGDCFFRSGNLRALEILVELYDLDVSLQQDSDEMGNYYFLDMHVAAVCDAMAVAFHGREAKPDGARMRDLVEEARDRIN